MSARLSRAAPEERRARPRYPVKLAVHFLIRYGKVMSICGEGTSINISSTGMLFRTAKRLIAGERVAAAVDWPAAVDGTPAILVLHGKVIWMKGAQIGISISHYGFVAEQLSDLADERRLAELTTRHLTPTRPQSAFYTGVRQWRNSVVQRK